MRLKILFPIVFMFLLLPTAKADTPNLNIDYTYYSKSFHENFKNDITTTLESNNLDFVIYDSSSMLQNQHANLYYFSKEQSKNLEIVYYTDGTYYYLTFYNKGTEPIKYSNCDVYSNYYEGTDNSFGSLSNCINKINKFETNTMTLQPNNYATNGGLFYSYHIQNKQQMNYPYYISNETIPLNISEEIQVKFSNEEIITPTNAKDIFYANHTVSDESLNSDSSFETLFFVKAIFYLLFIIVLIVFFRIIFKFLKFLIPF
ncbi:MAG: hypothetical protein ACLTAK_01355 [Bacilli bacterium]